ncbi:MAG TPA: hypothetical protein VGK30_04935 [Candidatus Binatia bacterium]
MSLAAAALLLPLAAPAGAGAPGCSATPLAGCRATTVPAQSRLWLNNRSVNQRDTIVWKQRRSAANTTADFGDPVDAHGYALCMYNAGGSLIFHGTIPSGGTCGAHPCWRAAGAGYHYRNGQAAPDGLTKVLLRAGDAGHASVVVKGRGASLGLPPMPLTLPVTLQLQEESGPCWGSTFEGARMNDSARFRASAAH